MSSPTPPEGTDAALGGDDRIASGTGSHRIVDAPAPDGALLPADDVPPEAPAEAEQAGVLVWGKILAKFSDGLAPLLIVRLLGQADVGAFATLMLVYETILVLLTAGLPRAALFFLPERALADRRATTLRMVRLMVVLGGVAAGALAAVGIFAGQAVHIAGQRMVDLVGPSAMSSGPAIPAEIAYLPLLGVYALMDVPTRLLPSLLLAEGRTRASATVGIVRSLGSVSALLIPAALGWGLFGIMVALSAWGVCYAAFFWRWVAALYADVPAAERTLAGRDVPRMGVLVRFAISLGITDVVSRLNSSLDLWLIVLMFSSVDVAHYKSGAWQIPIVTTVAYSVGEVYLPRFAKLFAAQRGAEAIALWRESIAKVSLIVVPTAAIFVVSAEEFVTLAFTPEYAAAAPVFRCYCLLTAARVTAFGNVMLAAGRPDYVMRSAAFTFLSNLLISVPLVLTVGFVGPAMGTAIAFVPTVFYYCFFIAKAAGVSVRETFPLMAYLKVVAAVVPGCALATALKLAVAWHPALLFPLEAVIVATCFAAIGTLMGLITREDWRFVGQWLRLRAFRADRHT